MLLAIDVGNTQTVVGLFNNEQMVRHWRISTHPRKTNDEWALALSELLTINNAKIKEIDGVIISSVVPDVAQALRAMCKKTIGIEPLRVDAKTDTGVGIKTDNPDEVGADRIANSVAAVTLYGPPAIVVDFGTATTFDVISGDGDYIGGAIAPGIEISMNALFEHAARLSEIAIEEPKAAIGKNTTDSLRSGIVYGFAGQIDAIVRRILAEMPECEDTKVIATGGLAELIVPVSSTITDHDPLLTLKGLQEIFERAQSL